MVGSTSLAEAMDPEDWADIVNSTVSEMASCVERFGGTVAQFAGDSILAIFGAPVTHEDDPYRAVRAGLSILERMGQGRESVDIEVRAGIHTGLVVVGDVNAGELSTYTALGDTPNVAARMQTLATPGGLFVSADTYKLVANDVSARDLGPITVKGKMDPVSVYEITDVRDTSTRRRGIPGFMSPMVGRDAELTSLLELVHYSAAGRGRVAAIVGDAGVGKSRLVAELQTQVAAMDDASWIVGRSVSYDQHRPYHLVASLVLALVGAAAADDPQIIRKAVTETATPIFGADTPPPRYLLQLLGLEEGHPDDEAAVLHAHYAAAVGGLIAGVASEHSPLVMVCEDVHWADASSAELLSGLIELIPQESVLLVLVTRPDRQSHGWDVIARSTRDLGDTFVAANLQPLDGGNSRRLVANLLEIESLSDEVRELVLERAEGNPFFIEEVVRMLMDRDLIGEVDGRWVVTAEITSLDVPETLHGLLASRLDGLPVSARTVASVAAVIGRRFEDRLLRAVLESDQESSQSSPGADLGLLEARGVIKLVGTQPELEYSFRHALIHDVTYQSILRSQRRKLHAGVGEAIASLHGDRLEEQAPTLARHYEEAGAATEALHYLLMAGQAARSLHAMPESHAFYTRAVVLLEADESVSTEVRVDVALSRIEAGINFIPGEETVAQLEAIRSDAEKLDDPDVLARVYALMLRVRTILDENYANPGFRDAMDRAYALTPEVQNPELRAFLEGMMGQALRSADEYVASLELVAGTVGPLEAAGRVGEAGFNAALAADVEAARGRFAQADEWINRGASLAAASGNPNVIADVELIKGRIAAARGELDAALAHSTLGMETAEGAGNIQCTLVGNFLVADQQLRSGDAAAAIPHLERTFELGAYCNAEAMVALGHAWLATARARLGDLDSDAFTTPLEKAQLGGSRSGEAAVRLQRAIAVAASPEPDWDMAFTDFETAIALFEGIEARPDQARAMHAYANALEAAGRTDASTTQLSNAMAMFDDMGIRPDMVGA